VIIVTWVTIICLRPVKIILYLYAFQHQFPTVYRLPYNRELTLQKN
jgi:hypothetical protein